MFLRSVYTVPRGPRTGVSTDIFPPVTLAHCKKRSLPVSSRKTQKNKGASQHRGRAAMGRFWGGPRPFCFFNSVTNHKGHMFQNQASVPPFRARLSVTDDQCLQKGDQSLLFAVFCLFSDFFLFSQLKCKSCSLFV